MTYRYAHSSIAELLIEMAAEFRLTQIIFGEIYLFLRVISLIAQQIRWAAEYIQETIILYPPKIVLLAVLQDKKVNICIQKSTDLGLNHM